MWIKRKAKSKKQKVTTYFLKSFLLSAFCVLLSYCTTKTDKAPNSSAKFTQYYNQGEQLYEKNCSNCHQKNGTGLGRLYPPLNKSDYMSKNFDAVICLMRFGKKGELTVNGISFNQEMPGIPTLTDLEIAEIATYIYNTWEHQRGMIEVKAVSRIMENCPLPK
jgi:mono/diheme cytochrome c family protein